MASTKIRHYQNSKTPFNDQIQWKFTLSKFCSAILFLIWSIYWNLPFKEFLWHYFNEQEFTFYLIYSNFNWLFFVSKCFYSDSVYSTAIKFEAFLLLEFDLLPIRIYLANTCLVVCVYCIVLTSKQTSDQMSMQNFNIPSLCMRGENEWRPHLSFKYMVAADFLCWLFALQKENYLLLNWIRWRRNQDLCFMNTLTCRRSIS